MTANDPKEAADAWTMRAAEVVWRFGEELQSLHRTNPRPGSSLLDQAILHLMTELWDREFSQSEIRTAFEAALDEMPSYAAGEERRS